MATKLNEAELAISYRDTAHGRIYYPKNEIELLAIPDREASLHMSDCMALIVDSHDIQKGHEIVTKTSQQFIKLGRERLFGASLLIALIAIAVFPIWLQTDNTMLAALITGLGILFAIPPIIVIQQTLFAKHPETALLSMQAAVHKHGDQLFVEVGQMQQYFRHRHSPWANSSKPN